MIKYGTRTETALAFHTHINSGCYDKSKLEKCVISNYQLWVASNLGKGGLGVGSVTYPKGEVNICFTQTGMWGYSDGGGVQDQYKEELVKHVIDHLQGREKGCQPEYSPWYETLKLREKE